MRKLLCLLVALGVALPAAWAGGPPGRREGDRGGPRWDMFRGGETFGPRTRGNAFDALRRYFDLTPEQQATVAKLDEQRAADEREAMTDVAKRLDKKYSSLIVEVLPADQKAKYEQVLAALAARDDATEAAQKEFRGVLDKVRSVQGVTAGRRGPGFFGSSLPNSKPDIIRYCVNANEELRTALDGVQRDGWTAMREKTRDVARPQNWGDAAERQKYADGMRKIREQTDQQTAEAMALLLNEEQKKAYQTGATALDAYTKKVTEADDACEKKLTELVGAEKAKAMRAGWWQFPQVMQPGQPNPGGPAPKGPEQPKAKATEF